MPNTLAHIAIHTPITKKIIKKADLFWIYLGCIIPDIPWIIQRIVKFAAPSVDLIDLRIYSVIQATLFFSLILSFALSRFSDKKTKAFFILSLGSLLHLVIDAAQYKWANGVHFFAPFNWEMTNYGFFWPHSYLTYIVTTAGFIVGIFYLFKLENISERVEVNLGSISGYLSFLVYLFLPLLFLKGPSEENNHYVSTLKEVKDRKGEYIEIDRGFYDKEKNTLQIFTKEKFILTNHDIKKDSHISIKGRFKDKGTIEVIDYHLNEQFLRDLLSIIGLLIIFIYWLRKIRLRIK